jgi:hypothetical protein
MTSNQRANAQNTETRFGARQNTPMMLTFLGGVAFAQQFGECAPDGERFCSPIKPLPPVQPLSRDRQVELAHPLS